MGIICSFMSLVAWLIVISPIVVLIMWGSWLIIILGRDIIGLAVIMAGIALLLAFYSIMLWWRTQWQSSSMYHLPLHSQCKVMIPFKDLIFTLFKFHFVLLSNDFPSLINSFTSMLLHETHAECLCVISGRNF